MHLFLSVAALTLVNSSNDLKPAGLLEVLMESTKINKNEPEEYVFTTTKEYLDINVNVEWWKRGTSNNPNNAQVKLFVLCSQTLEGNNRAELWKISISLATSCGA